MRSDHLRRCSRELPGATRRIRRRWGIGTFGAAILLLPAFAAAAQTSESSRPACLAPDVTYEVHQRLALVKITIRTPCRAGQDATLEYGGATTVVPLAADGSGTAVIDCFAGTSDVLRVRFADRTEVMRAVPPVAANITKIAILWDDPVDLDLHAFEFGATFESDRHVWAGRTLRSDEAGATRLRGQGLMTTTGSGKSLGTNVEVYTFVHGDQSGIIRFAVDYVDRGDAPGAGRCGEAPLSVIRVRYIQLEGNTVVRRGTAEIGAAPCGVVLAPAARYTTKLLPEVRTSKP